MSDLATIIDNVRRSLRRPATDEEIIAYLVKTGEISDPATITADVADWIDSRVNCTFVYWPAPGRIERTDVYTGHSTHSSEVFYNKIGPVF